MWITWNQFGDFRWCTTSVMSPKPTWCSQFYSTNAFSLSLLHFLYCSRFFLHCSGDFLPCFRPPFRPYSTPFHSFSIIKVGSFILTVPFLFSIYIWCGFRLKLWVLFFSIFVSFQWFGEFIDYLFAFVILVVVVCPLLGLLVFSILVHHCFSVLGHHCFSVLGHHCSSRGMFFISFEVEN